MEDVEKMLEDEEKENQYLRDLSVKMKGELDRALLTLASVGIALIAGFIEKSNIIDSEGDVLSSKLLLKISASAFLACILSVLSMHKINYRIINKLASNGFERIVSEVTFLSKLSGALDYIAISLYFMGIICVFMYLLMK
jgi:hypothetical protein